MNTHEVDNSPLVDPSRVFTAKDILTDSEVKSIKEGTAEIKAIGDRQAEYSNQAAHDDYRKAQREVVESGDVDAMESLGSVQDWVARYKATTESLGQARQLAMTKAFRKNKGAFLKLIEALDAEASARYNAEEAQAKVLGVHFVPSSGTSALLKTARVYRQWYDRSEVQVPHLKSVFKGLIDFSS